MTTNTTAQKAQKVTLNSILFADAPALRELKEGENYTKTELKQFDKDMGDFIKATSIDLANYLVNKTEKVDVISNIFTATVAALPKVLEDREKARREEEERKEKERLAEEARKEEERKKAEREAQEKKDKMLKLLVEGGVDLETAKAVIEAGAKIVAPVTGTKNTYERVPCTIDGEKYDVPVRGNMAQVLKDLAAKYGFADDRDGFIAKFRDEPAVEEENADAENADA